MRQSPAGGPVRPGPPHQPVPAALLPAGVGGGQGPGVPPTRLPMVPPLLRPGHVPLRPPVGGVGGPGVRQPQRQARNNMVPQQDEVKVRSFLCSVFQQHFLDFPMKSTKSLHCSAPLLRPGHMFLHPSAGGVGGAGVRQLIRDFKRGIIWRFKDEVKVRSSFCIFLKTFSRTRSSILHCSAPLLRPGPVPLG